MIRAAIIIPLVIWLAVSILFYKALVQMSGVGAGLLYGYIAAELLVLAELGLTIYYFRKETKPVLFTLNYAMSILLAWILPRLAFVVTLGAAELLRRLVWWGRTGDAGAVEWLRWEYIAAALVLIFVLVMVVWGLTGAKYDYKVKRLVLEFDNLPPAFNGFTITQFSDVHAGSLDVRRAAKGIAVVNAQGSDLIVFTGDMVNNSAAELEGWQEILGSLSAPMGVYGILGNHDYGDYMRWGSGAEKQANLQRLVQLERGAGINMLLNEHAAIQRGGDTIYLAGVENWGARGFTQYGKLNKALAGIGKGSFVILLSHDPSHWDAEVLKSELPVALTLSGHTHGFQLGINIGRWMWSPIRYVYKHWGGLYEEAGKYLYINVGFGFHGLPGRIGMRPEVTVITLKRRS